MDWENLKNLQEAEPVDKNMQMVVVLAACQSPPLVLVDWSLPINNQGSVPISALGNKPGNLPSRTSQSS